MYTSNAEVLYTQPQTEVTLLHAPEISGELVCALGTAAVERGLTADEIIDRWERYGIVREAPRLSDQAVDDSRTTEFRFTWKSRRAVGGRNSATMSEVDGLHELYVLLDDYTKRRSAYDNHEERSQTERSLDVMENLTFIGAPEYDEAVLGMGAVWKAYLDADPAHTLCVVTVAAQHSWYVGQKRKSDDYLKNRILETFSDAELAKYSGRIIDNADDLVTAALDETRVVMLDDWTVSGKQMRDNYIRLMRRSPAFRQHALAGNVEVNLITAAAGLRQGLSVKGSEDVPGAVLPVRAYYGAHFAPTAVSTGNSYISGLHCAVNYGFGSVCEPLTKVIKDRDGNRVVPALSHIAPHYRTAQATIAISSSKLERVPFAEMPVRTDIAALVGAFALESELSGVAEDAK